MKRGIDILVAGLALLVLLPLLAVLAALVRINLGRPVLFRQTRPGLHGRPFSIVKFRSMRDARTADGTQLPDHVRLTRFGRFLRATSLDELPELWNVLKGDMALVGPRPLLMEYLPLYAPDQARRHEVRRGSQAGRRSTAAMRSRGKRDLRSMYGMSTIDRLGWI